MHLASAPSRREALEAITTRQQKQEVEGRQAVWIAAHSSGARRQRYPPLDPGQLARPTIGGQA